MTTSFEASRVELHVHDVHLDGFHGPLPEDSSFELRLDATALTLSGGEPLVAWEVPATATQGLTARRLAEHVEVAGWIAGGYSVLSIPLEGATADAEEMLRCLEAFGASVGSRRVSRRRWPWMLGVVLVAALLGGTVGLILSSSSSSNKHQLAAAERHDTMTKNLVITDLPSSWQRDNPSLAPLGGFLTPGTSGKQSARQKHASALVVTEFQSCMGLTNASDRTFGAAGVKPAYEVGGSPLGLFSPSQELEVGSATQRYSSNADVAADLVQLRSPKFPSCFAEALGRLVEIGVDPSLATSDLTVTTQQLASSLGVYAAGSNVLLTVKGSTGPIEIGVTEIIHAPYEQTLFTYSTPGTFSPALRAQLVSILAGRLAATGASAST